MATAAERLVSARTTLLFDQPFFAMLAMRLKTIESTARPTAWTNGKILGYNPDFIAKLSHDEIVAVLCHEVLHCALGHPWRRGGRDPKKWNYACDYAINPIIKDAKLKLPEGCLFNADFAGQSAEWIYDRLPDMPQGGEGDGDGDGGGEGGGQPGTGACDVSDAPKTGEGDGSGDGGQDAGMTEAEWREAVAQAAQAAKARGKLPGSLERFAVAAMKPKVDWRSVLHRFIQERAQDDFTWRRPNKRYIGRGIYLPSMHSEAMGPIAVAIDTSGSIDDVTLGQFEAEVRAVCDEVKPARVHVIYCDAEVHQVDVFERGDDIRLKMIGGGGTSHVPVMDAVDAMDEEPVALICLTDLYTSHRDEPPCCPVLWATIGSTDAPYGEIVEVQ